MAQEIVQIQTMGDALRNTGYKNIECAMSEIIDNSVQAEAEDIFVVVSERLNKRTGHNNINEIAFLDNGQGMTVEELGGCLGIGVTTRGDRKGMGRFGVGLPQASLYACPIVEVYSWQGGIDNCKMVSLDINKVKTGEQVVIEDPITREVPQKFAQYLSYNIISGNGTETIDFSEHGTMVIWKECDRVSPKTIRFLFEHLKYALGQKFRYFIDEDGCRIRLIHHENPSFSFDVLPNDPLMLLPNNLVLGNPEKPGEVGLCAPGFTEPVFEPFTDEQHPDGKVMLPVDYIDPENGVKKTAYVELRFSIVRDIFYDITAMPKDPGGQPMGKHVKTLEGISIVRANREIDFGKFDFYEDINEPQHRWWGCEIRFSPELDEAFGVANNKQHVELHSVDPADYEDDEVKPVWLQLAGIVRSTIKAMYEKNKETRKKSRSVDDVITQTAEIINSAEAADTDHASSESETTKDAISEAELMEKKREDLKSQGIESPSDEEVRTYMNNKVNIRHVNLGKLGPIFDYQFALGSCDVKLNMDHSFYKGFLEKVFEEGPDAKIAFELFICSLARAIDETNSFQESQNDNLVTKWNEKLRRYIDEQNNYSKS